MTLINEGIKSKHPKRIAFPPGVRHKPPKTLRKTYLNKIDFFCLILEFRSEKFLLNYS